MERPIILTGALLLSYFVLFGCATTPQPRELTPDSGKAKTAYELSEVDTPPRLIRKIDPLYPVAAKSEKIQGKVTLRFIVTKDGRVDEATVVKAAPSGVFSDSALKAILSWQFRPATKDGKPVNVIIIVPLIFELVEDGVTE